MAKGEKYLALTAYLQKSEKDIIKMSFREIETVLGESLPKSAYKYSAMWSNSRSHSIALSWMCAGYVSKNVSILHHTVEFVKNNYVNRIAISKNKMNKKKATLNVEDAVRYIQTYYADTVKDQHGRYLSWCHCYTAFKENRNQKDEQIVDYLALNLAFYLASWGMYRGSSFLLQKDYKVHVPIVKIILEDKYTPLLGITPESLLDESMLNLLDDISNRIRKTYAKEQSTVGGSTNNATDTLVTKILLGTLGCVPAYDRYYVQAVRKYGISSGGYDRRSVQDVARYYLSHKNRFEEVRKELCRSGIEYPAMKIMDMCLWQVSFEDNKHL